eukprot:4798994-Pleurochrysis_carterae.AAC.1
MAEAAAEAHLLQRNDRFASLLLPFVLLVQESTRPLSKLVPRYVPLADRRCTRGIPSIVGILGTRRHRAACQWGTIRRRSACGGSGR